MTETETTARHAEWRADYADLAAQVAEDRRRLRDGEIDFTFAEIV